MSKQGWKLNVPSHLWVYMTFYRKASPLPYSIHHQQWWKNLQNMSQMKHKEVHHVFQNNYQQDDTYGLSFISGLVILHSTCFELQGAHHQEFTFLLYRQPLAYCVIFCCVPPVGVHKCHLVGNYFGSTHVLITTRKIIWCHSPAGYKTPQPQMWYEPAKRLSAF